jgi:hypothetical protein
MPSPAEQPSGSRPWWREPVPPDDDQPAPGGPPVTAEAPGSVTSPSRIERPGGRRAAGADDDTALMPPVVDPAPSGRSPSGPADPADATVVMAPVPVDATRELPPVPADPAGYAPAPPPGRFAPDPPGGLFAPNVPPGPPATGGIPAPAFTGGIPVPAGSRPARSALYPSAPAPAPAPAPSPAPSAPTAGPETLDADPGNPADGPTGHPTGDGVGATGDGERPARDSRATLTTVGGAILVLVLVVAGAGLLVTRLRNNSSGRAPAASVTALDLRNVQASASSVQKPDGGITYTAGNTLDGNLETAWNSNGAVDGPGPGITMTYRFTSAVNLRTITLRDGYQKVRPNGVDLWERNERVHRLEVTTDAGHWTWDLKDIRDPQTLAKDFGRTTSVRFTIVSVYPGTKYTDVGISEIAFGAAP